MNKPLSPEDALRSLGAQVEHLKPIEGGRHQNTGDVFSRFVFDGDRNVVAPNDLVRGLLPKEGLSFIGGQSQAGKTFIVIDLARCLATGDDFFGHKVREQVGVAILAAEGQGTIVNRLAAMKKHHEISETLPISYLGDIPDLKDAAQKTALCDALRLVDKHYRTRFNCRLGVVLYDTLAATFDLEDENDNSEASKITRILKMIGAETKTLSIAVHHYGGNVQAGLRGATAWRGNCDSIISVLADIDQVTGKVDKRELALAKNRDGVSGPIAPFELAFVELGQDEDGAPFGTCAVVAKVGEPSGMSKRRRTEARSLIVFREAFMECLLNSGKPFTIKDGPTVQAVKVSDLRAEFARRYGTGEADPQKQADSARKAFTRSLEKLGTEYVTEIRGAEEFIWKS